MMILRALVTTTDIPNATDPTVQEELNKNHKNVYVEVFGIVH